MIYRKLSKDAKKIALQEVSNFYYKSNNIKFYTPNRILILNINHDKINFSENGNLIECQENLLKL